MIYVLIGFPPKYRNNHYYVFVVSNIMNIKVGFKHLKINSTNVILKTDVTDIWGFLIISCNFMYCICQVTHIACSYTRHAAKVEVLVQIGIVYVSIITKLNIKGISKHKANLNFTKINIPHTSISRQVYVEFPY